MGRRPHSMDTGMGLKIYNSLTRTREEFVPVEDGKVRMYVCGPTVYSDAHVGHAMAAIVFDMVRRYLTFRGYAVRYVTNFTDVDDKIIRRANETGQDPVELAKRYAGEYLRHLDDLNVQPADEYPRVSNEISEIIAFIQDLGEAGYAYELDGDVYFRVAKDDDYGKLSRRSLQEAMSARVEEDGAREAPPTSPCGSRPSPVNRPGTARGGLVAPAGTSNALPCACTIWAKPSTSTAAAMTLSSRTTKTGSPRVKA